MESKHIFIQYSNCDTRIENVTYVVSQ